MVIRPNFKLSAIDMGLVLGVEAAVGITESAEAAAVATGAGDGIAGVAETTEIIDNSASAGLEAGTKAGSEATAAASEGEGALSKTLDLLRKAVPKIIKMVGEFALINTAFEVAKSILEGFSSDPITQHRTERLGKLIYVLNECSTIMKNLSDWLEENGEDTTNIGDITVTMQGVLSQFLPSLASVSTLHQ